MNTNVGNLMDDIAKEHAIVFSHPNSVTNLPFARRELKQGEVALRVETSAISPGTELRCLDGNEANAPNFPFIPGYNLTGTIVDAGTSCTLAHGTRVFASGTLDAGGLALGWGGHVSQAICVEGGVCPLPEELDFVGGALAGLLAIAIRGVRHAQAKAGESVLILGLGIIGHFSALAFKQLGCHVLALDHNTNRVEYLRDSGVSAYKVERGRLAEALGGISQAPNIAVDCTGNSENIGPLLHHLRGNPWGNGGFGSRLVLQGSYIKPISFDYPEAFEREIQICVPRASSGHDLQLALKIWRQLKFDASIIAPSASPLDAATVYKKLATKKFQGLTAVFDWRKPSSSLPKA